MHILLFVLCFSSVMQDGKKKAQQPQKQSETESAALVSVRRQERPSTSRCVGSCPFTAPAEWKL